MHLQFLTANSKLPCSTGVLGLLWRSRTWAVFISALPVNFKDQSFPQKSNTYNHKEADKAGRTWLLILHLAQPGQTAPNQELTPKA